jgi:hypothetical protein
MKLIQLISEIRRNSEHFSQERLGTLEELKKYAGRKNIYISFTDVDKIGINPQSQYTTPIGVYTYPLFSIFTSMERENTVKILPFSNAPHISILESNEVTNLDTYNSLDADIQKIRHICKKYNINFDHTIITNSLEKQHAGARFWYITEKCAEQISKSKNQKIQISWNWLLRQIGYKGFTTATGIIHNNEPIQAVFLSGDSYKLVKRIDNKYSDIYKMKNKKEKEQLEYLRNNPKYIQYIHKPSETAQMFAVSMNGLLLCSIIEPSEKVQCAAIDQNTSAIKCINNPSENIQLFAVQKNYTSIQYIDNPTEKIQSYVVEKDVYSIKYIKNPLEKIQIYVVSREGYLIKYIINPSENAQLEAVKESVESIRHIHNPLESVQLYAIRKSRDAIRYIKNPSEKAIDLHRTLWD